MTQDFNEEMVPTTRIGKIFNILERVFRYAMKNDTWQQLSSCKAHKLTIEGMVGWNEDSKSMLQTENAA